MIKILKKIIILILAYILVLSNVCYAEVNYTGDFRSLSDLNVTIFMDQNYRDLKVKDLVVIGDSYAVFFSYHNNKAFNYVVHPGYKVKQIYDELVPMYKGQHKYVFLFIGANDFMQKTDIHDFKKDLELIVDTFKDKGMQVILSSYLKPNYNTFISYFLHFYTVPCEDFDAVVKKVAVDKKLLFIDTSDLLTTYGFQPNDFIHPSEGFCKELLKRVAKVIKEDEDAKLSPSYEKDFYVKMIKDMSKYNDEINRVSEKYFNKDQE